MCVCVGMYGGGGGEKSVREKLWLCEHLSNLASFFSLCGGTKFHGFLFALL